MVKGRAALLMVLLVMTASLHDVSNLGTKLWAKGISTEVHLQQELPVQNSHSSHQRGSAEERGRAYNSTGSDDIWFPNVDSKFLYGRDVLFRRRMAVLVLGPTDWVLDAALQLMPRGVFGPRDTLILAPVGRTIQASVLCPSIPVATRLLALEVQRAEDATAVKCVGLVREARLLRGRYALRSVGCWRNGHFVLRAPLLPDVTSLEGAPLSIRIPGSTNEVVVKTEGDSLVIEGYLGQMLTYFMKNLKFTPKFNGRDKHFKDYLDALESDLAMATLSFLPERAEIFDYSEWYWIINNRFITKVPSLMDDSFLLFQIFQWKTHCVIAGFLVVSSAMLAVTWRVSDMDEKDALRKTRRRKRVYIAVTTALKTAVYMSSEDQPRNAAGRLVLMAAWLVAIVLVALYNGNLTAFLSIPRVEKVPETVQQLMDMGYTLSINNVFSQYVKFKNSPIADHQGAFREAEIRSHSTILPPEIYINRARTQPLALLVNNWASHELLNTYVKSVGSVKVCTLKPSSEPLFLEIGGLGFPKNSPLKPLFDHQMSWIRITNLINHPGPKCVMENLRSKEAEPLGMVKMAGVMALWVAGVAIACVLFLAELIYSKLNKR